MTAIRVYGIPFSTNVERVALALGHKGLDAEWVMVDPRDRTAVEELSGQPLVPVIEHEGRVISDSMVIVRYLEDRHPERPLYPRGPARRAETLVFIDWFNRVWKRPPNDIEAELGKPAPDRARIDELAAEMPPRSTCSSSCSTGASTSWGSSPPPTAARFRSSSTHAAGGRTTTSSSTRSSTVTRCSARTTRGSPLGYGASTSARALAYLVV